MSWFDTKGLASLAKTALKEAQKQIDKVLDIQDEEQSSLQNEYFHDNKYNILSPAYTSTANSTENPPSSLSSSPTTTTTTTTATTTKTTTLVTVPPKMGEINKDMMAFNLYSTKKQITPSNHSTNVSDSSETAIREADVELPAEEANNSPTPSSSAAEESIVIISTSSDNVATVNALVTSRTESSVVKENDTDSTQSFEDIHLHSNDDDDMQNSKRQSSSNRSDCSPLNSNDELETATSSDIEIISSPNCDGSASSTTSNTTEKLHSKQKDNPNTSSASPLASVSGSPSSALITQSYSSAANNNKKNEIHKGHYREPSEISIISIDSQSEDEFEKLTNRIAELNSLVEAKTLTLLEIERKNSLLQSRNNELQSMLDANNLQLNETANEDYTKRMSALEKKFQASIREREALRIQIKELQERIPSEDLRQALSENQIMVEELRREGDKLAKEILQQSNIIKKLRVKEKTTDGQLKNTKEQLHLAEEEVERLKKTLSAKAEVERSQIEAVHKMSAENRKLEKDNHHLSSKLEDNQQKLNTLQHSFEAVKCELQQRSKQNTDLNHTKEIAQAAEKANELLKKENQLLQKQLQELLEKLRLCEEETMKREQQFRDENRQLLARLETAELRAELSTQEISETTTPLMRQIESLQQTLDSRSSDWNRREHNLQEKLQIYQTRLKSLENIEISTKEEINLLKTHCKHLENRITEARLEENEIKNAYENQIKESQTNALKEISKLNDDLENAQQEINKLKECERDLQMQLKQTIAMNKTNISERISDDNNLTDSYQDHRPDTYRYNKQRADSPANSNSMNLLEEIIDNQTTDWHQDDLECISNTGQTLSIANNLGYSFIGSHNNNTTSTLEHLQALLKQKDGELMQHQWDISRLQAERNLLQEELSQRTLDNENLKETLHSYEMIEINYNDLQTRYDALLQMYGEKVEQTQELQLDLKECREAYKVQIQELLAKLKTN